MLWSPIAAAVVRCVRVTRRAVAPAPLTGLTMQQASALLAPRPRVIRRAVAIGCPAGVLPAVPHVAVAPGLPLPVPPVPAAPPPLPFGIGGGPLLPPGWTAPPGGWLPTLPDVPVDTVASVPEPAALALFAVALVVLAAVRRVAARAAILRDSERRRP